MPKNKGIALPVTIIVVIGVSVLVLASIALFFLSTGGMQISKADAERIFQTKCRTYCDSTDNEKNLQLAAWLNNGNDPEFVTACRVKGIDLDDSKFASPLASRCLEACPCDMTVYPTNSFELRNQALTCLNEGIC